MYGWVHQCLVETIIDLCGEEKWKEIIAKSSIQDREILFEKDTYYDDEEYFSLVDTTNVSEEYLFNAHGDFFISYLQKTGFESYLLTFGDTLIELLNNVNRLHAHMACTMEKMKGPTVSCERCEDKKDSFMLSYASPRGPRLTHMLAGLVKSIGRSYFSVDVTMQERARQGDASGSACTIWKVGVAWDMNARVF